LRQTLSVVQLVPPSLLHGRVQNPPVYRPLPLDVSVLQYAPAPIAEHSKLLVHGSPIFFGADTQAPAWQVWLLLQSAQVRPAVPHEATVLPGWQPLGPQHPLGQLELLQVGMHSPIGQVAGVGHALQKPPPLPQYWLLCIEKGTHLPLSQQPLGQLVALHVPVEAQMPLLHVSLVMQLLQTWPPVPQLTGL
jgi:hypothetical protein